MRITNKSVQRIMTNTNSLLIRQKGESRNGGYDRSKRRSKKCLFFEKIGVL